MTWQPLNLSAAEFAVPSDPPALCGLIYLRKRHVISSPPEGNKTLVALILTLEAMRAGIVAAFVDFESGPAEVRRMLEDVGASPEEIGSLLYFEPDGPPTEETIAYLLAEGVGFLVVDAAAGAYSVSGLDDNARADVESFARSWIQPLWQQGVTTVLIDHVTKNAEARGRFAIGSERKLGAADVHLGLDVSKQLTRGGSGLVKVKVHKDRPGHLVRPVPREFEFVSDPVTHAITWSVREPVATIEGDGWKPTYLMQKVSEFLVTQPDGASRNAILTAVRGKSNDAKRQAIDELVSGGYATEAGGARGAKIVSHVRPYTSPDLVGTSPGEVSPDLAHLAAPPKGGEVAGEVDELERLWSKHADLAAEGRLS